MFLKSAWCRPSQCPSHTLELHLICIRRVPLRSSAPSLNMQTLSHTPAYFLHASSRDLFLSSRILVRFFPPAERDSAGWGFNEHQGQRRAIYSMHSLIRDINNLDQDWTLNLELLPPEKFISIRHCLRLLSVCLIVPLGQWDEFSHSAYAIFPPSISVITGKPFSSLYAIF